MKNKKIIKKLTETSGNKQRATLKLEYSKELSTN